MDDLNVELDSDDYQAALDSGLLPIREVARATGVNAVTLRAWERRYGLIVPQRTPKGHRLYAQEHVERIQAILTWLNRGVSVSQVKGLLDARQPVNDNLDNGWQALRLELLQAIGDLAERRLDEGFNRALALYPPRTLCEQLLLPLLLDLEQRWQGQFGAQLEQVFFYTWLRSKLGARIYHNNRQHSSAPLLLANLSIQPMEPGLWLCAWLVSSADCPVEVLDWALPPGELNLAVERMAPRALLLYSSQALDATQLRRQLPKLNESCSVPVLMVGPAASIHQQELRALSALHLAEDPLSAQRSLLRQGLLDPR
ncbi:MAG: MerR family transcriptional regulator [Pseudomonas sp.]|uniref:MerR family transcriptional regulator n=1 Tax=Pseudomonas sp. TaxID=306 RepID=UPI003397AAE6